jgi:hypothetical protein
MPDRGSFRPDGAEDPAWNAFPGLRYAPSWAILIPSLREEVRRFNGWRRGMEQFFSNATSSCECPAISILADSRRAGEFPRRMADRGSASSEERLRASPETRYNLFMLLAKLAMDVLEVMFFVGLAGSAVVVLISFIEDGKELVGKDEPPESRAG